MKAFAQRNTLGNWVVVGVWPCYFLVFCFWMHLNHNMWRPLSVDFWSEGPRVRVALEMGLHVVAAEVNGFESLDSPRFVGFLGLLVIEPLKVKTKEKAEEQRFQVLV